MVQYDMRFDTYWKWYSIRVCNWIYLLQALCFHWKTCQLQLNAISQVYLVVGGRLNCLLVIFLAYAYKNSLSLKVLLFHFDFFNLSWGLVVGFAIEVRYWSVWYMALANFTSKSLDRNPVHFNTFLNRWDVSAKEEYTHSKIIGLLF